jgi:hypothetical protein
MPRARQQKFLPKEVHEVHSAFALMSLGHELCNLRSSCTFMKFMPNKGRRKMRKSQKEVHEVHWTFCFMSLGRELVTFPHVHEVHDVHEVHRR